MPGDRTPSATGNHNIEEEEQPAAPAIPVLADLFCFDIKDYFDDTTRNMTFCDKFPVTSELFVISTFNFMTISMRWGGLVTKKRCSSLIPTRNRHKIAAFIAEPVMGAGGVIAPPKTYFEKVTRITC
uniref:Uncharacterized protein n=1 Tax=Oryza rufipogon TaxID=4529 RepID=A0A0E0QXE7_ORYRU